MTDLAKKHLVFIVNPKSGIERRKAIRHIIDAKLDFSIYSFDIQYTKYAGHGTELAATAAKAGAYAVVAVGGDGSVNEVVKGLISSDTILAIIPKGSGNGMARSMRIPLNTTKAIEVINRGRVGVMDVGYANDILFISNAGVGFDALIADQFTHSETRGLFSYFWLVVRYLWTYREPTWSVQIDGQHFHEEAFILNVANGEQFGYNFKIAPQASFNDGHLDVVVIRKFPRLHGAMLALAALNGTLTRSRWVRHYRAKHVVIAHPDLNMMQTDGDAHPTGSEVRIRIKPGAQRVILP